MRINNNTFAMNTANILAQREMAQGKSLEKLSSGFRINRAGDDAAGLIISQKLRAEVSSLKVAARNTQDAISIMQVAEGAMARISEHLQRMHDLQIQHANIDASDTTSKDALAKEFDELNAANGFVFTNTAWGDSKLFVGGFNRTFQVGIEAGDTIVADQVAAIAATSLDAFALFNTTNPQIDGTLDYSVIGGSGTVDMMTGVANAIDDVANARAWFGAIQNRLESTLDRLQIQTENLANSESRIRDTDMASEMANFTRHQILHDAGTAMLAQANTLPQNVLRLLG